MHDADAHAADIYRRAGHHLEAPPGPVALARALGLRVVARHGVRGARLARETREILTAPRLAPASLCWLVAHEIAEWHLDEYVEPDREQACDSVAAALIMPRASFVDALASLGGSAASLPLVSQAFRTSQSVAGLRYGEVTGRPVALVTPSRIHVRGDAWGWPPHEARASFLDAILSEGGVSSHPLSDARRRTLVIVSQ